MRGVPEHAGLVVLERSKCSGDMSFVVAGPTWDGRDDVGMKASPRVFKHLTRHAKGLCLIPWSLRDIDYKISAGKGHNCISAQLGNLLPLSVVMDCWVYVKGNREVEKESSSSFYFVGRAVEAQRRYEPHSCWCTNWPLNSTWPERLSWLLCLFSFWPIYWSVWKIT